MRVVLDASAALAWLVPSQATQAADDYLDRADRLAFQVPAVFDLEVRNSLLRLERRRALPASRYEVALVSLENLDIEHQNCLERPRNIALAGLARQERISLFDMHYLDLAITRQAPLASRDGGLLAAAKRHGVAVHDLRDRTDDA